MGGRGGRRSPSSAATDFDPESLGHVTLRAVRNVCFTVFVLGVVIFTVIAANYEPDDPLLRPSSRITSFLTSTSNATFHTEGAVTRTGEDFIAANASSSSADAKTSEPFLTTTDMDASGEEEETTAEAGAIATAGRAAEATDCDPSKPIECRMPEVYHLMMRAAMETFKDVHFYKFGKPSQGGNDTTCDMAWRFQPKNPKTPSFYKDYRRFLIRRAPDCSHAVLSIGEYHSGVNARKRKKGLAGKNDSGNGATTASGSSSAVPLVGDDALVDDSLPVVKSDDVFTKGKYLVYTSGGERCKSMDHYLWSLLCALGEARYLNRTLVLDLSICLSPEYTQHGGEQGEEGKDFRFYFDLQHLKESSSVLDHRQFWSYWGRLHRKRRLRLHLVEDFRVTPMRLATVKDALVMRKFGTVEPDNYWYRVCEGEAEPVVPRPWELVWKSRRLMGIVSAIASRLNWDFDAVHVVRGEKAKNRELWPNLDADTSGEKLLATLKEKGVKDGRNLFIATNEAEPGFFEPLRDRYKIYLLGDFKDLWAENSEWYWETKKLNSGVGVEFDGYMKQEVDTEVFLRGKKQLETFNDLTSDCKDGINTCSKASAR